MATGCTYFEGISPTGCYFYGVDLYGKTLYRPVQWTAGRSNFTKLLDSDCKSCDARTPAYRKRALLRGPAFTAPSLARLNVGKRQ